MEIAYFLSSGSEQHMKKATINNVIYAGEILCEDQMENTGHWTAAVMVNSSTDFSLQHLFQS